MKTKNGSDRRMSSVAWDAFGILGVATLGSYACGFVKAGTAFAGTAILALVICLVTCIEVVE